MTEVIPAHICLPGVVCIVPSTQTPHRYWRICSGITLFHIHPLRRADISNKLRNTKVVAVSFVLTPLQQPIR